MKARPWELGLAALALLLVVLFSVCDWSSWHPGFNSFDEEGSIARLQLSREGVAAPTTALSGRLGTLALASSVACLGPHLSSLHIVVLVGFLLECFFLALLAQRLFSERAAVWAVLVNCVCAFTLMRVRSLLSYAFTPLEWLALLLLLPYASTRLSAFAWGLLAAALLFDYEAWALGFVGLGLTFWWARRGEKVVFWAIAGMLIGLAVAVVLSWKMLEGYTTLRLAMTAPKGPVDLALSFAKAFKSFWLGGAYLSFIAATEQSAFPWWAWPLLAAGLFAAWKKWKLGLVWAFLGLLPMLLSHDGFAEPQRALLAWPALCLIAGAGAEALLAMKVRLVPFALVLLCLVGGATEGHAYLKSIHEHYVETYGESANLLAAVQALKKNEAGPRRFITELSYKSAAPLRFLLADLKQASDSREVVAFVPWEYAPAMKEGNWGRRERIVSQVWEAYSPPILLYPAPDKIRRLDAIEAQLRPLWSKASLDGIFQVREAALGYLDAHPQADAWVRTACWEGFLDSAMILRQIPRQRVDQAMREPLVSATFYEWMTRVSLYEDKDPHLSLNYATAALKLDPSRENSRKLYQEALRRVQLLP